MDCLEGMKCFPDKYFELAIVDPVYGDVSKGGYMNNDSEGLAENRNYHLSLWIQQKTSYEYFAELFRVSRNQVIWGGNFFTTMINKDSQGWIVWNKLRPEGVTFADCELAWTSFDTPIKMFTYMWHGMLQQDMKHKEYRIHPTQKPVALYEWILNKYAKPGDVILDTHVGSASSLIACHNTNHKYVGFEIDKEYYRLAKERLDRETAQMNIYDFIGGN